MGRERAPASGSAQRGRAGGRNFVAGSGEARMLRWSFALGADLADNATIIASSASVVVGIADRSGHHISFWKFSRYGLIVTAATVTVATRCVWLRYSVLAQS